MFTAFTMEEDRMINGEFLDWTDQDCHLMTEHQFIKAQEACAQAWGALSHYMRDTPQSVFTEINENRAPALLASAIIDVYSYTAESASCALASGPTMRFLPYSVDQLCDAALEHMGFIVARDEFGVDIIADIITFAKAIK